MYIGRIARALREPVRFEAAMIADGQNGHYERFYPYYAELCALSEIRKKPGFGVHFRSGIGGHLLLYLGGVCLDRSAGYPMLKLCDRTVEPAARGVGVSVNSHYRNANWVAAEGRDFVFRGALTTGESLTRETYERTQDHAKAMGVLDGVEFHEHLFRDKPRHMSQRDYMYEISVATDYAVAFGREIYRARVALDRQRMQIIVDFLNALNAPYREGKRVYRWRLFKDNCSHVAHNALARAGIWAPWPEKRLSAVAAADFPVPKNEFVDLMRQTNDLPIDDPRALYGNVVARRALLEADALPTAPGGLAAVQPAIANNEIYETDRLRLIFYDNPLWGQYHRHLARIFREPRYFDLQTNLRHFAALYQKARNDMPAANGSGEMARFLAQYERHIDREMAQIETRLAAAAYPVTARAEVLV